MLNDWEWTDNPWGDEDIRFNPATMQLRGIVSANAISEPPEPAEPPFDTERAESAAHLADILDQFARDFSAKYMAGQKEHGGVLSRKPGLREHAKEEVLDLVAYVYSREGQELEAIDLLRDALTKQEWGSVKLAYNLLVYGNREGI